jgi:xylulose-5-phosphate/fructose-6-phosphate phosphoketolase
MDVIDRVPRLRERAAHVKQALTDILVEHRAYIERHGDDMPSVRDWQWTAKR